MNTPRLGCALLTTLLAVSACQKNQNHDTKAEPTSEQPPVSHESADAEPHAAKASPLWPDGWLVVSQDEWIPVLNVAGSELTAARTAFVNKDYPAASAHTRAAAKAIRADANAKESAKDGTSTDSGAAQLEGAAKKLDALASKLDEKKSISQEEFDQAFTSAYRADAERDWLHLSTDAMIPTFEKPRTHFQRALTSLQSKDNAGAASEIRRGTAYFRLAAQSARTDDRKLLDSEVAKLNELAKRAEKGELSPTDLKSALARVDSAYASSYLHQAEEQYRKDERTEAGRSLREAVARMRARLTWLGQEAESASNALMQEIEQASAELAKGTKLTARKATDLFERAKRSLGIAEESDKSGDHG